MEDRASVSSVEGAAILKVSERTVRRMMEREELEGYTDGRAYRIYLDSVLALLESNASEEQYTDTGSDTDAGEDGIADTADIEEEAVRKDVRNSESDARKVSAMKSSPADSSDSPADISELSGEVRSALQNVSDGTEVLISRLIFEHNKRKKLEEKLLEVFRELSIPFNNKMKKKPSRLFLKSVFSLFLISVVLYRWLPDILPWIANLIK